MSEIKHMNQIIVVFKRMETKLIGLKVPDGRAAN